MMKRILLSFMMLLLVSCSAYRILQAEHLIEWNPVCRHDAIYWASVVDEQYPVRFAFGKWYEYERGPKMGQPYKEYGTYTWHVQPQVKIGENWYYFKVEYDTVIIITMPKFWKVDYVMSKKDYVDYLFRIDREKK